MPRKIPLTFCLLVLLSGQWVPGRAAGKADDLHLKAENLTSFRLDSTRQILVFEGGFTLSIGADRISSDIAVVWLSRGRGYQAKVYLQGNPSTEKGKDGQIIELRQTVIQTGYAVAVEFSFGGSIYATADERKIADPRRSEPYFTAYEMLRTVGLEPVNFGIEKAEKLSEETDEPEDKEPVFMYPINLSPMGKEPIKIETDYVPGLGKVGTVTVRFYLWQKQDDNGGLLEFEADNAVLFWAEERGQPDPNRTDGQRILPGGSIKAIYLAGDVQVTEGLRTFRAEEVYYDFEQTKMVAIEAEMRTFDPVEGTPIYLRATKIRQLAQNKFSADDMTLTTSEFHVPQISLNASKITITDTTPTDQQEGEVSKSSYDALLEDVRLKANDMTFFYWPSLRTNLERPDLPIKSIYVGHDSTWGTSVETRWYLARLLGLQEPEGTDSTLALDYFGKRGFGGGVQTNYTGEKYLGRVLGYIIHDTGEDRLGRHSSRKNLKPPRELRGRFRWQHRQYLPYNWQLTSEVSYASDEHFIEGYYRGEFNVGKEQETLVHLKRIEDNWGLAFLGKVRINDFVDKLEELPTSEFHWTGQSFFDDRLTLYSDTQVSRFRQRFASSDPTPGSEEFFTFTTTRNEVDMPLTVGKAKVVPFVAGTVAYEDGLGFYRELDGGTATRQDGVWFGETGVRISTNPYWKVFPGVKSKLWDLNQLRHVIRPHLTAVTYTQTESVIEQRDTFNVGISQRLQTKRGLGDRQRNVDWMRLDMDITWVNDSGDASAGPDKFLWNKPLIPPINRFGSTVPLVGAPGTLAPQQDRRGSHIFGPRRNYFGADYIWRLSDTTAVLSDMNFDIQSGVVQQYNVGVSHLRWPNLQFYLGSRYLRRIDNSFGENGTNAVTFAVTYALDPRYTMVFSQQYDFDYGKTVRNDVTLIRRYHRIYWGLTYSADKSLDEQSIGFSLWPQGVKGLAFGERRYAGLGASAGY
ncbi:MAG: hypothetical protein JSW47_00195 [Phycisphaerales bacterium]|nr:MAG: hypothetical protein JSW47_00195 [Phycisphaerales bacterium]